MKTFWQMSSEGFDLAKQAMEHAQDVYCLFAKDSVKGRDLLAFAEERYKDFLDAMMILWRYCDENRK